MRSTSDLGLTDLPSCRGWEFGDFPYALEPLTLPDAGTADANGSPGNPAGEASDACAYVCEYIRMVGQGRAALDDVEPGGAADELYWFRWITGHQVCFVIWRLMAQVADEAAEADVPLAGAHARLATYVRGYCIMLLYTGSCPRSVYETVIRPSMRLQHRSFTGGWASDYWPLRSLFRTGGSRLTGLPGAAELVSSLKLHRVVHDGVSAKLVPDGKSLLRKSLLRNLSARGEDPRLFNIIYDNFFMTLRAPVSRQDVIAQLMRRLVAIAQDVAVNDLHCAPTAELAERPAELHTAEVIACESEFSDILFEVATCAGDVAVGDPTLDVATGR